MIEEKQVNMYEKIHENWIYIKKDKLSALIVCIEGKNEQKIEKREKGSLEPRDVEIYRWNIKMTTIV